MGEGWGEGEIRHPRHCEDLPLILSLSKDHPELVEGRANPVTNHTQKILSIPFILSIQVKPGSPSPLTPTPLRPRKSPLYHQPCQVKTRQSTNHTPARGFRSTAIRQQKSQIGASQTAGAYCFNAPVGPVTADATTLRAATRPSPACLSERNQGLNQLCVPTGRMLTTTRNLWRNPTTHHPLPDHPQQYVKPTS